MQTRYPRISRVGCLFCLRIFSITQSGTMRQVGAAVCPSYAPIETTGRDAPPPESGVTGIDALDNLIGIQEKNSNVVLR